MSAVTSLSGPGTDTIAIGDRDGHVVLQFKDPVRWVKLDPATALQVGEALAQRSYKALFGDFPAEGKKQLTEQLRIRLRNRVSLMLRGFAGRAPVPPYEVQANEIVDACLHEVA